MGKPVTIFGEHEQKTIDQLQVCMQDDRAVAGALCADGHLGYSMPIGGVVAYQDAISPSGVGFDIACVDGESEFLSAYGWRRIQDYNGELVMQYDPETGIGALVKPTFVVQQCKEMLRLKTKYGIDQMVTDDHRLLIWPYISNKRSNHPNVVNAKDFASWHNNLALGYWADFETSFSVSRESRLGLSDEEIRVQVMVNADAYLDVGARSTKAVVSVKKERKAVRAQALLEDAQIDYTRTQHGGYTTFRFGPPLAEKSYDSFWGCSREQLLVVTDECLHWDGNVATPCFYTRDESAADFIQYAFTATGRRAVKRMDTDGSAVDYRVFAYERTKIGMRSSPKTAIEYEPTEDGKAYCFQVPSGFWVMRRNGKIVMTGNCGNKAVMTGLYMDDDFYPTVPLLMQRIRETVAFGLGRSNAQPIDHALFDSPVWDELDTEPGQPLKQKAAAQLGTVGSGNHYVDLLVDEEDRIWVACHFGSRGFGHTVASGFLAVAQGKRFSDRVKESEEPAVLDIGTPGGDLYVEAMRLAGEYAYAGRDYVIEQVLGILGTHALESVHVHHNFAWLEDGLWVVRKGATPLGLEPAFIGGSMGDVSVIVRGAPDIGTSEGHIFGVEDIGALGSAPHGAGRVMSRTKAAGKFKKMTETRQRPDGTGYSFKVRRRDPSTAAIDWPAVHAELTGRGITVLGSGADEAPAVYKDLRTVLSAHPNIEVLHELQPVGVVMAGDDIRDPYQD